MLKFPGYGYRRTTETLRREGWTVNHKKVLRVMRKESLLRQLKRRFRPTPGSTHSFKRYPNLIKTAVRRARSGIGFGHHLRPVSHHLLLLYLHPG